MTLYAPLRPLDAPRAPRGRCREELAWAAGIFDGEGYIGSKIRKTPGGRRNPYIQMSISQYHDAEVVERFTAALGIGSSSSRRRETARGPGVEYLWRVQSFEKVQAAVAVLWPWLSGPKRRQAVQALQSFHGEREVLGVREWRRRVASFG